MNRKEYIELQKGKGKKVFGIFPAHYPKEIFWAMDILPVEIWDPPLEVTQANAHLQPYICSVVKLGLELILQGKCDNLDGFLFPHTCDSIQNMASIVFDYLEIKKPCYFFYHPKAPYRSSSRIYYREQLEDLINRLTDQIGPLNPEKLAQGVAQGQEVAEQLREIYKMRSRGELAMSNEVFYRTIRKGEYLLPEDYIPILKSLRNDAADNPGSGTAVILSGVLPNPPEILTTLDGMAVRVANDDLLCCRRRTPTTKGSKGDSLAILEETYFSMPPCTTKGSPLSERLQFLLDMVRESDAKGVIFPIVKFCEPELFDLPQLSDGLKSNGIPTLIFDVELNQGVSGQLRTRLEAFIEMIS